MKKLFLVPLLSVLIVGLVFAGCAAPTPTSTPTPTPAPTPTSTPITTPTPTSTPTAKPAPIVLTVVTFQVQTHPSVQGYRLFAEEINKRAGGELVVKYLGSTEAIAQDQQISAVATGIVDIVATALGFGHAITLESDPFMKVSTMTPMEERQAGVYDLLRQHLAAKNLRFMMRLNRNPFYVYTKVPVSTLADIPKIKIRTSSATLPVLKGLGFVPVVTSSQEAYTAMERGVVDGIITVPQNFLEGGFTKITKYVINHKIELYHQALLMNLNTWNRLPDHLKKLIEDVAIAVEPQMVAYDQQANDAALEQTIAAGVQPITLSPADAQQYLANAAQSEWADLQKLDPELYSKAKELFTKP